MAEFFLVRVYYTDSARPITRVRQPTITDALAYAQEQAMLREVRQTDVTAGSIMWAQFTLLWEAAEAGQ